MFTYLAARLQVLDINAQGAAIADTELDLSGSIPDGAHSALVLVEMIPVALGVGAANEFHVYKSLAQGDQVKMWQLGVQNDQFHETAVIPISADRKIRYSFVWAGVPATCDLNIWLLGYIE